MVVAVQRRAQLVVTTPFTPLTAVKAALVAASVARVQRERDTFGFLLLWATAARLTTTIAPTTHFI